MKLFKPTLVAVALVSVLGCQQETKQAEVVEVKLETEQQKQAYSLGASIGMYMERNLAEQEKLGLNLDRELIVTGFLESLEGKSKIEQEEIQTLLMALDQETKVKQQEMAEKAAQDSLAEGQNSLKKMPKKKA